MRRVTALVPGRLETRTGGYGYDRRILQGLAERGWAPEVVRLADTFPVPDAAALAHAADALSRVPDRGLVLADGLAFGAMPDAAEAEGGRLRLVALVHHPLAAETGLSAEAAARLEASERRALATARRVVVTSGQTAAALAAYGVAPARVAVIEPGTDPAPLAAGSGGPTPALVAVGAVVPRKGYDVLCDALAALGDRDWRLTIVGSLDRDPAEAERVRARLEAAGLAGRVRLAGDLPEAAVGRVCAGADLFVSSSRYEGYGMALAEALARGLPVVATRVGAAEALVGADAGRLVAPGDAAALADALAAVLDDPALRRRLAAGAAEARRRLPSWDAACDAMADVLDEAARG